MQSINYAIIILITLLPIIESFDREFGFKILLVIALLFTISTIKLVKRLSLFSLLFLIFLTFTLASSIFSLSIVRSFTEYLRYFAYFLIFLSVSSDFSSSKIFEKKFAMTIVISTTILCILSFIYHQPRFGLSPPQNTMNLFYTAFRHNRITDILIFAIPIVQSLSFPKFFTKKISLKLILLILFTSMLIWTRGIAAITALSLSYCFVLLSKRGKMSSLHKYGLTLTIITIVLIIGSFAISNIPSFFPFKDLARGFYKPLQYEQRIEYLIQALQGWKTSKLIGTGLDTYRFSSKFYQAAPGHWSWYAHNHYIQLFTETGIIGGGLFISLILLTMVSCVNICMKSLQSDDRNASIINALFIGAFASILLSLIDYPWQFHSIFLYFWIALAIILSRKKQQTYILSASAKYLILTIFLVLSIARVFFISDSEAILKQSNQFIASEDYADALSLLINQNKLDQRNGELTQAIAGIYTLRNEFDNAHLWYEKSIKLLSYDSQETIIQDYQLYMKEIELSLDQNNFPRAYGLYTISLRKYPIIHLKFSGWKIYREINTLLLESRLSASAESLNTYSKFVLSEIENLTLTPSDIITTVDMFTK